MRYSPIDNPIEMAFNALKQQWIRHHVFLQSLSTAAAIQFCMDASYRDPAFSAPATYAACGYTP